MTKEYQSTHRDEFLAKRQEGVEQTKAMNLPNIIVVDAGDEVICDRCNAEIVEEFIYVDDWGAACPECRQVMS